MIVISRTAAGSYRHEMPVSGWFGHLQTLIVDTQYLHCSQCHAACSHLEFLVDASVLLVFRHAETRHCICGVPIWLVIQAVA